MEAVGIRMGVHVRAFIVGDGAGGRGRRRRIVQGSERALNARPAGVTVGLPGSGISSTETVPARVARVGHRLAFAVVLAVALAVLAVWLAAP